MNTQKELTANQISALKSFYFMYANELVAQLSSIPDKDLRDIYYGPKNFSTNELIEMIRNIEPIGVDHVVMHINVRGDLKRIEAEKKTNRKLILSILEKLRAKKK